MQRSRRLIIMLSLAIMLLMPTAILAFFRNYAPIHSNFKHTLQAGDDTPPGLVLSGSRIVRGSTTIADIDGNTANGKEIIVGGGDGTLYAYHQNGSLLWSYKVASCTFASVDYGTELIAGAPAVGDLLGNGTIDVVVGYGAFVKPSSCTNNDFAGVVAINGATGALVWRFKSAFDDMNSFTLNAVLGSPALADVDGDGKLEVGFGSTNNNVYLADSSGNMLWKYRAYDSILSTPAFADINGDGRKEMIVGTDFGPNNLTPQGKFPSAYGWLYAFDTTGGPGQSRQFGQGYIWAKQFDQVIWSAPAVADLDGDGKQEIVVGSGCFYNNTGNWVKIIDAATGNTKTTMTTTGCVVSSPALGDLNGDGKLDIVAASSNKADGKGRVVAWSATGAQLWSTVALAATAEGGDFIEPSNSPVIADLDGNGSLEVAVVVQNSVTIFRGDNGQILTSACGTSDGTPACQNSKALFMWYANRSTPAIGDVDNDGELELAIGGSHTNAAFGGGDYAAGKGLLYAWRDFGTFLGSPAGNLPAYSAPWPMFHGNAEHNGVYPQLVAQSSVTALVKVSTTRNYPLSFKRSDDGALNWTISETDPSNVITLNRTSGTDSDQLVITFHAPAGAGTYNASLTLQSSGFAPVSIPITLIAANNVYSVNLPLSLR
jgi:hypothetical protein